MSNKNLTVQIPDGSIPEVKLDAEAVAKWDAKVDTTDLPNIMKNPDAADGDIIDTHLTIGHRKGAVGMSSIVTGSSNEASSTYSAVIGGQINTASGIESAVIGGNSNVASGSYSAVIGGGYNIASNANSAVIGGRENTASGLDSAVIGGTFNKASGDSAVIGGMFNEAGGIESAVIGGYENMALSHQLKTGHYAKDGMEGNPQVQQVMRLSLVMVMVKHLTNAQMLSV